MTKANVPTIQELQAAVLEARKHLTAVRVEVAEGIANADQLAEAEKNLSFAETRLTGMEEARKSRQRKHHQQRVGEILEELTAIDPLIEEAQKLEESIKQQVEELQLKTLEIGAEVGGAYRELDTIRERNRDLLKDAGIMVTLSSTAVRVGGKLYAARNVNQMLADLQGAITRVRRPKPPVAQRPPRKPKAA